LILFPPVSCTSITISGTSPKISVCIACPSE
jgi:hypothetical protein